MSIHRASGLRDGETEVSRTPLRVGDLALEVVLAVDSDGAPIVLLLPTTCKLEGEMPGEYFLVPFTDEDRADWTDEQRARHDAALAALPAEEEAKS